MVAVAVVLFWGNADGWGGLGGEGAVEKWGSGEVWKCLMGREPKGVGTASVVSDQ